MLVVREGQNTTHLDSMSQVAIERVRKLPEFSEAKRISSYIAKGGEVRTEILIREMLSEWKNVLVPFIEEGSNNLRFSELRDFDEDLKVGRFGILEPRRESRRITQGLDVDIVIVPGIAWTPDGFRIGYGKGYYDKYLAALNRNILTIGLSYEFQLVPEIPVGNYDIAVQIITTEKRVIKCKL